MAREDPQEGSAGRGRGGEVKAGQCHHLWSRLVLSSGALRGQWQWLAHCPPGLSLSWMSHTVSASSLHGCASPTADHRPQRWAGHGVRCPARFCCHPKSPTRVPGPSGSHQLPSPGLVLLPQVATVEGSPAPGAPAGGGASPTRPPGTSTPCPGLPQARLLPQATVSRAVCPGPGWEAQNSSCRVQRCQATL